jgi:hypothetical protein
MTGVHGIPEEVVAAIAAALSSSLDVPPERLRLSISGTAPPDDDRGAWQLLGTMEQMRSRIGRR